MEKGGGEGSREVVEKVGERWWTWWENRGREVTETVREGKVGDR